MNRGLHRKYRHIGEDHRLERKTDTRGDLSGFFLLKGKGAIKTVKVKKETRKS